MQTGTIKQFQVSDRTRNLKYAIRDLVLLAREVEKTKGPVLYANIGDPCKTGFSTPMTLRNALSNGSVTEGAMSGYGDSEGLVELRKAVSNLEKTKGLEYSLTDILITYGVSEAIGYFCAAIEPSSEILLPGPHYPTYQSFAELYGLQPIDYRCDEGNGWQPDIEDLRSKITTKTRAIVVINPNNPTGGLYSEKTVKQICDLAGEHDLVIISDEIYDKLVLDGDPIIPTAKVASEVPVLTFNGISKVYIAPGWRLGWALLHDPLGQIQELWNSFNKQSRIRLSAPTPIMAAGANALNQESIHDHVPSFVKSLRERREVLTEEIESIDGLSLTPPGGAFYAFPKIEDPKWQDDWKFCVKFLQDQQVLFVPGRGFGEEYGKGHFRIVFLSEPSILKEMMRRVRIFLEQ